MSLKALVLPDCAPGPAYSINTLLYAELRKKKEKFICTFILFSIAVSELCGVSRAWNCTHVHCTLFMCTGQYCGVQLCGVPVSLYWSGPECAGRAGRPSLPPCFLTRHPVPRPSQCLYTVGQERSVTTARCGGMWRGAGTGE